MSSTRKGNFWKLKKTELLLCVTFFSVQVNNLVSGMLGSIERHIRRRDYGQLVISNADFPRTKGALTAK